MMYYAIDGLRLPFSKKPSTLIFGFSIDFIPEEDLDPEDSFAFRIVFLFWKITFWK